MFRMILYTQWKWSRLAVALGAVAAFALPVLSIGQFGVARASRWEVQSMLGSIQAWGVLYPVLALGLGLAVAALAWTYDHRGRHVYALSLPVPRWHYVLLRFGAGAVLLGGPVIALWAGALVAAGSATIPAGLHAYPNTLALRFALAVLVAYSMLFAASSATMRTARYFLAAIGVLVAIDVIAAIAGVNIHIFESVFLRILVWPGPFDIITGRWMLIDV
jgi:hypothetical protein